MVVGKNVTILADNEARAKTTLLPGGGLLTEEAVEEFFVGIFSPKRAGPRCGRGGSAASELLCRRDVDDRGHGTLGDTGQRGELARRARGRLGWLLALACVEEGKRQQWRHAPEQHEGEQHTGHHPEARQL